mmetsp:Transcript_6412/g.22578  ORF Transcript_6412/g.22578 Transcript_6412/m.22578 type:complete len:307 (+) Transcript_6412:322-1242(+)
MLGATMPLIRSRSSGNGLAANSLNSFSSSSVRLGMRRPPPPSSLTPTTRMYGVWMATAWRLPPSFLLDAWPPCMMEYTPTALTRVPGVSFCTMWRSTVSIRLRGISPAGTSSGFSCSLRVCKSTNVLFSGTCWYGSRLQPPPPMAPSAGPPRSHVLGSCTPPWPGLTARYLKFLQSLHWIASVFALSLARLAAITMPETLTSRDTSLLPRERRGRVSSSELSVTCTFGASTSSSAWGALRMDMATSTAACSSTGRNSAGLARIACAREGSCPMTSSMATSSVVGGGSSWAKASRYRATPSRACASG